jgi:chromosome segregation ATPase
MSAEEKDLETHVMLCELRYRALETRLDGLQFRLDKLETDVSSLKTQMQSGFNEIKILLEQRNTSKTNQTIMTLGAIVVACITALGYIITKT